VIFKPFHYFDTGCAAYWERWFSACIAGSRYGAQRDDRRKCPNRIESGVI
jgi:hypothetical protein